MLRLTLLTTAIGAVLVAPAHAQSICNDSELAFVGRAEAPVTFRVSGEAEIDKARQNLRRTEEEIAQLQASLDERSRLERGAEFARRLSRAKNELSMRQAIYPAPYEATFIPLVVVRPFRGVSEGILWMHARPGLPPLHFGEEYLIYGGRSKTLIPALPEMGDLAALPDYVEARTVLHASSAQQHVQFLASTASGATVMGTLTMRSFGDGLPVPLGGVRILVSSGGQVVETITREDGHFVASGISTGELDITAALSSDLTLVDRPTRTVVVRNGTCASVGLRAALNGRVRGRIVSASPAALDTITLNLFAAREDRHIMGTHDVHIETRASADGSFEFIGVPPGSYFLSAWFERMVSDRRHTITTYYPGTGDINAATPIVVGKATQHDGFDFIVRTE